MGVCVRERGEIAFGWESVSNDPSGGLKDDKRFYLAAKTF